jgi:hypothetical protein
MVLEGDDSFAPGLYQARSKQGCTSGRRAQSNALCPQHAGQDFSIAKAILERESQSIFSKAICQLEGSSLSLPRLDQHQGEFRALAVARIFGCENGKPVLPAAGVHEASTALAQSLEPRGPRAQHGNGVSGVTKPGREQRG